MVAAHKKESKLSEAKKVRCKAAEVETGEGNSVLDFLTEQVAYLMATLDTKSSSPDNQRNREGQKTKVNGPGSQGLDNRNGAH